MNKTTAIALFLVAFCFSIVIAQNDTTTQPQTIDGQFEKLLKTSSNFEDFKVIKKYKIYQLKENTQKHIVGLNSQISTLEGNINSLSSQIVALKASLSNTQTILKGIDKEKNSMKFFGSLISKSGYSTMVWSIVGLLLLGLSFFIFKFKNSNILTKQAHRKLEEVELNFEDYKRKSLEKEQKVGRLLQDERNKLAKATNAN